MTDIRNLAASFRDPAGRVFESSGSIYRVVLPRGEPAYHQLMSSGLYRALTAAGYLVAHEELGARRDLAPAGVVLKPTRVPVISYPYEWAFSALKDAAQLTLAVARKALSHGMMLKDASAFNVQFIGCRPVFIDTLSFEPRRPGAWVAYRQFCEHFVAPLALMTHADVRLGMLSRLFLDGTPLDLASSLLPRRSWLRFGLILHLHAHARAQRLLAPATTVKAAHGAQATGRSDAGALIDSLERLIDSFSWSPSSAWTAYECDRASYSAEAFAHKEAVVESWLDVLSPRMVWDIGANTGHFSRAAAARGAITLALDADAGCVEVMYQQAQRARQATLLPLVYDLVAPTPGLGWNSQERAPLGDRAHPDVVLALAVVHHLVIGRGVPFDELSRVLRQLARVLIIEFVPKHDPMVAKMLAHRDDVFDDYSQAAFETAFAEQFVIRERVLLRGSDRVLYLMTCHDG